MRTFSPVPFLLLGACGAASAPTRGSGAASAAAPPVSVAGPAAPATPNAAPAEPAASSAEPSAPVAGGKLTLDQARRYMVELVNRDRKSQGLAPVALDAGPATAAAQRHADDMLRLGFLGHWGSDGSVPEQRHTEAGGVDMVLENALCMTDESRRAPDAHLLLDRSEIERAERMFFDEVPPNDGHRKNILRPQHTHVGIGIALPLRTPTEIPVPCFVQELTDHYATYEPLPKTATPRQMVHLAATLDARMTPGGFGIARVDLPKPLPPAELNRRRSYPVPVPYQNYWPPGFKTPLPVQITGSTMRLDAPLGDQPGLYEISTWAKPAGGVGEYRMIGLRTVRVER